MTKTLSGRKFELCLCLTYLQAVVELTWGNRTTFTGRGGTNFNLTCTDETWENPNWELGQIYSSRTITCDKVDKTFKPDELTAVA